MEELEVGAENMDRDNLVRSSTSENQAGGSQNGGLAMPTGSNPAPGAKHLPLPIGTPPKRNDNATAELIKHAQKLGGMPIHKQPPGVPPGMSIHDQIAFAQFTQAATAAYLRDKQQQAAAAVCNNISSPPRAGQPANQPAAGVPHNMGMSANPRNVPYPHPIPQGGRVQRSMGNNPGGRNNQSQQQQHGRYPNSNNSNSYGHQRNDNRRGHHHLMKEHEPIVKGLMSQKEMEWIFKVQMMQLKMTDYHVEDYYYQQWVKSRKSSNGGVPPSPNPSSLSQKQEPSSTGSNDQHPLAAKLAQSNQSESAQVPQTSGGGGSRDRKVTETSSDGEANQSSSQSNQPETAASEKHEGSSSSSLANGATSGENQAPKKAYEPTRFDNTLGKISVGSVYKPRKLMDIEYVCRDTMNTGSVPCGSSILKDSKRHREHLLFIEKCLTLFDEMELSKRKLSSSRRENGQRESDKQVEGFNLETRGNKKEEEVKKLILKHFDFNQLQDIVKNILLCAEKGCRLLAKLLTLFSDEENILVMLAIVNNLYILIKKETSFYQAAGKSRKNGKHCFGSSLCESMKGAINRLDSNIDSVEILEMLVSTNNWKSSTFATSLLAVLFECIAKGKDEDSFSYQRLIEILTSLESQENGACSNDASQSNLDDVSNSSSTKSTSSKGGPSKVELYDFVTNNSSSLRHNLHLLEADVQFPHFSKFLLSSLSS